MKTPITHPVLGELTYDAGLDWYEGRLVVEGDVGRVYLSLDACDDEDDLLSFAAARIPETPDVVRRARLYSARTFLDLRNSEWLAEGEAPTSEAQFVARLELESVTFYPDHTREVTFRDGGLFCGHLVTVTVDADAECEDASIGG